MALRRRFLETVVRHDFGDVTREVVRSLMERGAQDVFSLVQNVNATKNTKLPAIETAEVKRCLVVLLAHNVVSANAKPGKAVATGKKRKGGAAAVKFEYTLDTEAVRQRISYPWYILLAKGRFGREGEFLLETFAQHGALLLKQAVDLCIGRLLEGEEDGADHDLEEDTRATVVGVFHQLIKRRYLRPAQTIGMAAAASAKRRKLNKENGRDEDEDGMEDDGEAHMGDEDAANTRMTAAALEGGDETTFWCINSPAFVAELRNQQVVEHVKRTVSPLAARVVSLLFAANPNAAASSPYPVSAAKIKELSLSPIVIPGQPVEHAKLEESELTRALGVLSSEHCGVLVRTEDGYLLNGVAVFDELRLKQVQSIVAGKYDQLAARVFALLLTHKRLEEKDVVEKATAPRAKVRAALHLMLKDGFISLQEIAKSAMREPSKMFHLWGVPLTKVYEDVQDQLLFTWINLRQRVSANNDRVKAILDKMDMQEALGEVERAELEKYKKADDRLWLSLMNMDKLIMLFRDF